MTILERLKELVGTCDRRVTFDLESPNCRCGDIEQMGKCWCGCYENVLEHAERIRDENAWLRDTLPVLLEVVEALERTTRSLAAYLDYAPESMTEKTYAPYEALHKAHQALDKLEVKVGKDKENG
jgi:hypothetical protein